MTKSLKTTNRKEAVAVALAAGLQQKYSLSFTLIGSGVFSVELVQCESAWWFDPPSASNFGLYFNQIYIQFRQLKIPVGHPSTPIEGQNWNLIHILGLNPSTFRSRMRKYGINIPTR
jgi:hypothetical protein